VKRACEEQNLEETCYRVTKEFFQDSSDDFLVETLKKTLLESLSSSLGSNFRRILSKAMSDNEGEGF
jgi:hypothetical protein